MAPGHSSTKGSTNMKTLFAHFAAAAAAGIMSAVTVAAGCMQI